MTKAKFFTLSCMVAILAIGSQAVWMRHVSRSVSVRVRATSVRAPEPEQARARAESSQLLERGQPFWYVGICLAGVSLVLWLLCLSRREPVWRSIPFALLVFYALLCMIMI
jgi:hypothetical protein